MKNLFRSSTAAALCSLAFLSGTAHALPVPNLINYQGRVTVGSVNFDGNGQFKFALVNAAGNTTFWINSPDTNPQDGEPDSAVSLTVTKGLYSVLLGDTTLANMLAIPATVFNNPDVRLRVWFNDGINGYQLLTPDQRLAPTAYLSDGSVSSDKIASGAVGSTQLSANAVGGTQLDTDAVTAGKIAANAVTAGKIAASQVVKSLNGLTDAVTLTGGNNVTLNKSGNNIEITSSGGGGNVINDGTTLDGLGTVASPLGIATPLTLSSSWTLFPVFTTVLTVNSHSYGSAISGTITANNNGNPTIIGTNNGPGRGVEGISVSGAGVRGVSTSNDGMFGSSGKNGVHGYSTSATDSGVWGDSNAGNGVTGSTSAAGVNIAAVWGTNTASGGTAIVAKSTGTNSTGIYAIGTNYAGYFDGKVLVKSLTIIGGADLAEPFQMSANNIPKGTVMVIDDAHEGKLKPSAQSYDTHVAGIVSGAYGVNPGITMHQDGVIEGGQNVALSGRVYVMADTSNGSIQPGDLLTTSDLPGHAMKVTDHGHAQGAILGKAMSSLAEGTGMVLVLVTLQ